MAVVKSFSFINYQLNLSKMDATEVSKNAGLTDGYGSWKNDMDDYIYKKTNF